MAKIVFITFFIACFCLFSTYGNEDEDVKKFWHIRENAIFQSRFAKVEIEKVIYEIVKNAKDKAQNDEQIECIDVAKSKHIIASNDILKETVTKIMPAIEEVSATLRTGDHKKLEEFLNNYNYPEYKKEAMKQFKAKVNELKPIVQQDVDKCIA
uniref:Heteropteran venom family 1 protein 1 n=1 Tax=Oncocephalus sp. TaxID=2944721 RepID=A0AB38ZEE6_9HEMI